MPGKVAMRQRPSLRTLAHHTFILRRHEQCSCRSLCKVGRWTPVRWVFKVAPFLDLRMFATMTVKPSERRTTRTNSLRAQQACPQSSSPSNSLVSLQLACCSQTCSMMAWTVWTSTSLQTSRTRSCKYARIRASLTASLSRSSRLMAASGLGSAARLRRLSKAQKP